MDVHKKGALTPWNFLTVNLEKTHGNHGIIMPPSFLNNFYGQS